jgi:deoxyadenosine/deoxycytidine kinase
MSLFANGHFLVVEGNIGAGKTSLSRRLAADFDAKLILEEFSDNPFLPLFYQNPERYAFPVELFFMTERHKQLQELLIERDLFKNYSISDYIFFKTILFAGQNLQGDEFRLFQRLFHTLNASFPKPDLLLYLHRPVEELLVQIKRRNRSYELGIKADYLQKIQSAYFQFFQTHADQFPIVILDLEGRDFVHQPKDYQWIQDLLQEQYPVGLHYVSGREGE